MHQIGMPVLKAHHAVYSCDIKVSGLLNFSNNFLSLEGNFNSDVFDVFAA